MEKNIKISEIHNFLFSSINDIQSTIRAIDSKFNFILIILLIPIYKIQIIFHIINSFILRTINIYYLIALIILFSLFFCSWFFSFVFTILGLSSIDNPIDHIKKPSPLAKGLFYIGNQFSFNFFKNKNIISKKSHEELINDYLAESFSIIHELSLEQLKVSYIRDIKIYRQKLAYFFMTIWIFLGLVIYTIYKILT